jgi:predicted DNA-binding transcriptional regulator AlpA
MKSKWDLATVAADPSRIESVQPDALPALIGEAEALRAKLWARLQASAAPTPAPAPVREIGGPDTLLTAEQAAERLGVDRRWIYRHADTLPFARKLSPGTLRFSARGLERWKESRAA